MEALRLEDAVLVNAATQQIAISQDTKSVLGYVD
jgi:hypothetical protein